MAGKKQALGRGLDALFGETETPVPIRAAADRDRDRERESTPGNGGEGAATSGNAGLFVDIDEIKPNSAQPRQFFDPEKIEELAASIESHGVIEPVVLRKANIGYELVTGERRWRAARKAGLREIPAIVRDISDEESAMIAIIENMQREDLNTVEEARAYQLIIQKYGITQEELAKAVGKSRPYIANTLRVLAMQEEIVDMLGRGALTLGHANALGAVKDARLQLALARKVVKKGLSVRETERLAALTEKLPAGKGADRTKSDEIRGVEQELTSVTGVRVRINGDGKKGSVELRYFDRQGLEEIIELLRKGGVGK